MSKLEKLQGGFVNETYKTDSQVIKHFTGEELVGIPATTRKLREQYSLKEFRLRKVSCFFNPSGWIS